MCILCACVVVYHFLIFPIPFFMCLLCVFTVYVVGDLCVCCVWLVCHSCVCPIRFCELAVCFFCICGVCFFVCFAYGLRIMFCIFITFFMNLLRALSTYVLCACVFCV